MSKEELAEWVPKIRQQYGSQLTDEQAVRLVEKETAQPKSRAEYRVAATRGMSGGKRIAKDEGNSDEVQKIDGAGDDPDALAKNNVAMFEFESAKYAVLESGQQIALKVHRKGDTSKPVKVSYKTKDGTANAGTDYVHVEGTLEFKADETEQPITVTII